MGDSKVIRKQYQGRFLNETGTSSSEDIVVGVEPRNSKMLVQLEHTILRDTEAADLSGDFKILDLGLYKQKILLKSLLGKSTDVNEIKQRLVKSTRSFHNKDFVRLDLLKPHEYVKLGLLNEDDAQAFDDIEILKKEPKSTDRWAKVKQRVGQQLFRTKQFEYWEGRCCLTGITDKQLLRASHIKPWALCETDAERLDVNNGLLLSCLWDAAFDGGLVTFDKIKGVIRSSHLSEAGRIALLEPEQKLELSETAWRYLTWHRENIFKD